MFSTRVQAILVASMLIGLGLGLTLYKAISLGFPLLPGEYRVVWTLESKINFSMIFEVVRSLDGGKAKSIVAFQ